nr:response regulator [Gammaproteobacteria bacterium]
TIAEDSKQALKAVNKQTFDFIFMDIGLPDQDGIYIAKMIRQTVGSNQHVPIVALTAHANEQVKKDCIKVGMNSVIYKPLNKEKAETALQQFVIGEKIAENSTVAGDCIIDLDSAAQMMNGKESAIELFIKFGESLIPDKAEMEQTFANRDWPGMRKVLHRLKGGLCYCKAPSLSRARTRFHEAVKASENPKIEDLQPLYKKMMQELDVLMQEIKRRFK